MKNVIKKIVIVLFISMIILSVNMKVFANYNEWTAALWGYEINSSGEVTKTLKGEEVNKNLAKFIKSKKEKDLKKAYDTGDISTTWVKDAMKKLESKKDSTYKEAYEKLETWDYVFDSYIQQKKQTTEIESDTNDTKDYKNFTLKQMIDTYEKAGHSLEGIKKAKDGEAILNKWYKVVVEENTGLDSSLKSEKVANCPSSEEKKDTYESARKGLSQVLQAWKKEKDKKEEEYEQNPIYQQPGQKNDGKNLSSEKSLEDMVNDADTFINSGTAQYDQTSMQNFSKTIYNIMFTIGVFVAVIMGGAIGIKLMISSASEKAEAKKLLVPYVVGCVVVFGGFGIWKLVVTILQGI